jgi:hypothetical protein
MKEHSQCLINRAASSSILYKISMGIIHNSELRLRLIFSIADPYDFCPDLHPDPELNDFCSKNFTGHFLW